MTYAKIIEVIKGIREFASKEYKLSATVRMAIRRNHKALVEEYKIYDEEYRQLTEGYDEKSAEEKAEINKELIELLNTKVEVDIQKVPYESLANVDMSLGDEDLLMFMIEE